MITKVYKSDVHIFVVLSKGYITVLKSINTFNFRTMEFSLKPNSIKSGWSILYSEEKV